MIQKLKSWFSTSPVVGERWFQEVDRIVGETLWALSKSERKITPALRHYVDASLERFKTEGKAPNLEEFLVVMQKEILNSYDPNLVSAFRQKIQQNHEFLDPNSFSSDTARDRLARELSDLLFDSKRKVASLSAQSLYQLGLRSASVSDPTRFITSVKSQMFGVWDERLSFPLLELWQKLRGFDAATLESMQIQNSTHGFISATKSWLHGFLAFWISPIFILFQTLLALPARIARFCGTWLLFFFAYIRESIGWIFQFFQLDNKNGIAQRIYTSALNVVGQSTMRITVAMLSRFFYFYLKPYYFLMWPYRVARFFAQICRIIEQDHDFNSVFVESLPVVRVISFHEVK